MRVNDHFHDRRSSDGRGTLDEHCRAAARGGLDGLCMTNHAEILDPGGSWILDVAEAEMRFRASAQEVEAARHRHPGLRIGLGAEFAYRPEWVRPLARLRESVDFDFVIGSLHDVDGIDISGGDQVDRFFADRSLEAAYGRYFEALGDLVSWGDFDVVGHFDLVKRYGHRHYGAYRPEALETPIRAVLSAMARRDIGLEVNASGFFQAPSAPYPDARILEWAREEGVDKLTIGNDAHRPRDIARGLDRAAQTARRAGWERVTVFGGGEPRRVDLEASAWPVRPPPP